MSYVLFLNCFQTWGEEERGLFIAFPLPPQQEKKRKWKVWGFCSFFLNSFLTIALTTPKWAVLLQLHLLPGEWLSFFLLWCPPRMPFLVFSLQQNSPHSQVLAQTPPPRWARSGAPATCAASLSQLLWLWAHISIMLSYSPNIRWPPIYLPH